MKFTVDISYTQYQKGIIEIEADNEREAHERVEEEFINGNVDLSPYDGELNLSIRAK